jgi:RNA polymerase sigma-70 factor (ECF subfamily)
MSTLNSGIDAKVEYINPKSIENTYLSVDDMINLEDLMNTYSTMLLRMASIMLKDFKLAEDVVQETFINFYTSYSNYRGEAGIKTYLYKILINECRQKQRKAWFRRNILTAEPDRSSNANTDAVESAPVRLSLSEALKKLDTSTREALLLYYYNDLPITEISKILSKPEGTIKSKLKRGRDRLKSILQEDFCNE